MTDSDDTFSVNLGKFFEECYMPSGRNKLKIRLCFYFEEAKSEVFELSTKFSKKQIANKLKRYVRIEPFDKEKMKCKMTELENGECIKLSIHPITFFILDKKDYDNWMFLDKKSFESYTKCCIP